jgi:hypothetical protein
MANIRDMIKEKEDQITVFEAEISGLRAEIEALRLAAGIMAGRFGAEAARPVAAQTPVAADGDKRKRMWP